MTYFINTDQALIHIRYSEEYIDMTRLIILRKYHWELNMKFNTILTDNVRKHRLRVMDVIMGHQSIPCYFKRCL